MMGLEMGSFEAFCFDEAIWYLGTTIDGELEQAGHKPSKDEAKFKAARDKVLAKFFGATTQIKRTPGRFADPAVMFGNK